MLELCFNSRSQISNQTSASSNVCTVKLQSIQRVDLSDIIVLFLLHWQQEQLIILVRACLPPWKRACFTDTRTNAPYHLKAISFFCATLQLDASFYYVFGIQFSFKINERLFCFDVTVNHLRRTCYLTRNHLLLRRVHGVKQKTEPSKRT